jgi:hypothetical protein
MSRNTLVGLLLVAGFGLVGCEKSPPTNPVARAEAAVNEVLDAWTRGESPTRYASPDQPIRADDPDWKAGYRLMSFLSVESQPTGESPAPVRCRVALSLKDPRGKSVDKEVVYDVAVGSTVVITRAPR